MKKKHHKKQSTRKSKKKHQHKLVCPLCFKSKKAKRLNDGYTVCAYCGMVVYKQKYSLEKIDAPGFIIKSGNLKKVKR